MNQGLLNLRYLCPSQAFFSATAYQSR